MPEIVDADALSAWRVRARLDSAGGPSVENAAAWQLVSDEGTIAVARAWLEDTATMEDTYRAMLSGAKKFQHLQDEEILIRHNCKVVDDYVYS